jgi:DNA-binding HxlR family transcriptional regulator
MAGHNRTGRSKNKISGGFVALPYSVIDSPGYRATTSNSKAVFVQINRLYNGKNNGFLAVSSRMVGGLLNISHSSVARALRELVNCGLIRQTKASSFSQKRIAAEYRLTHKPCDKAQIPATMEYKIYCKSIHSISAVTINNKTIVPRVRHTGTSENHHSITTATINRLSITSDAVMIKN